MNIPGSVVAGRLALLLLVAAALAGCGTGSLSSVNPFAEEEETRLPGERVSVATAQEEAKIEATAENKPVALPEPSRNESWTQPGGVASNAPGHLELGGGNLATAWRADAGEGSSDEGRLTVSPLVYGNRVYTLDTEGTVTAFSASGGGRVWRTNLTPGKEDSSAGYGGGLAVDEGRLYAVTGFGTAVALDPASGKVLWTRRIGVPIRTSPTAADGKLYFVTTESRMYCLSGEKGDELWTHRGIPETAVLLSNVSPAVSGNRVVAPFPSGDVIAYDVGNGNSAWVESLARRSVSNSLAKLSDPARPAIHNGVVFAVSHAGRMVATRLSNGARMWTKSLRGTQMPWVTRNAVFVVDVTGTLLAMTRDGGEVHWTAELPEHAKWSGPVLAGGRLWLVSSQGLLLGVDAKTGEIATRRNLDEKVYIAPVVAGGRMYILADNARLFALN